MTADEQIYIQALALGIDGAWRRRTDDERRDDGARFAAAAADADTLGVRTITYSSIGLEAGVDVLLWRMAPSVDALEEGAACLLRSGLGRWLTVRHSFIGRIGPSQYVRKPTEQEQSLFAGDRSRYLVVYPFTKSTDWYHLSKEARQGVMNEHMRVGHDYPTIRQALAYSFGLDDQEFVVAYEMDDLVAFGDLVRALRSTESRRSTVNDKPILLGVHRPLDEILTLLGAGMTAEIGTATNDRFVRACRLEPVDATPVWFMRQAGRSFAAYRELRERYGILELAKTPDLCAEVTLMPVRELGVDAAVLFADIMLPLEPMGVDLRIEPEIGPIIERPIRSAADVDALRPFDPADVSFTLDAIRLVRRELDGSAGVIGFSGAPFTLACYLIEGRPSRDYAIAKAFMYREPEAWHRLMASLSTMVITYLQAQVDAGADVVQVFDSWVGGLGPTDYATYVQPHVRRIFDGMATVPTIHFGTGTSALLELMADAGGDVIGVDHRMSLADAWRRIGPERGIQGNLDSARLLAGWDATEAGARGVLDEAGGRPGHVFNLGHGVLPSTDTRLLRRLVDFVHETSQRPHAVEAER